MSVSSSKPVEVGHTPESWTIRHSEGGGEKYWHIDGPRRERIACTKSRLRANQIAACPDALAALRAFIEAEDGLAKVGIKDFDDFDYDGKLAAAMKMGRAALAKAVQP